MDKCREAFEKLPEIKIHLHNIKYDEEMKTYHPQMVGHLPFEFSAWFLNGGWLTWQSRQAEVDELNQLYLKAQHQEIRHRTIAQDALALVEEKDKRVEEALNHLNDVRNKGMDQSCYFAIKVLRANNANS